jgi:hypothetical protein
MELIPDTLLTRPKAAQFLTEQGYPTASSTLATKATRGGGPEYHCFGRRPLYRPAKLLEWARSRLSKPVRNTAEAGAVMTRNAISAVSPTVLTEGGRHV